MRLTVEQAQNVSQLRLKMVQNMQKGVPAESGIDEEVLRQALESIRADRSLGEASQAKGKGSSASTIPLDLGEFMKKKK